MTLRQEIEEKLVREILLPNKAGYLRFKLSKFIFSTVIPMVIEREICICSAIKFRKPNGEIKIIRGHRHGDCFLNVYNRKEKWEELEQGFITSKNNFVGRIDGRKLQDSAGIKSVSKDGYQNNTLFSEDLY